MRSVQPSIYDPIYGRYSLPSFLGPIIDSPEFQRLSLVRLLNFQSVELASLSEVRRLSHTLGVLLLGTKISPLGLSDDEIRGLLYAILLHDIGTPPFGHTLEYEFSRKYGLNHEEIILLILNGKHHKFNLDHQIFRGRTVTVSREIKKSGLSDLVREILERKSKLTSYIFSDIDLDNIDNVYRMAYYLGGQIDKSYPLELARTIDVDLYGNKRLSKRYRYLVDDWLKWRSFAYDVILNTAGHRQNQAIFSRLVWQAIDIGAITIDDWFLTDEQLLARLAAVTELRRFVRDLFLPTKMWEIARGVVPKKQLKRAQILDDRDEITSRIEKEIGETVYVSLINVGAAVSRSLSFIEPQDGARWVAGADVIRYRLHMFFHRRIEKSAFVRTAARALKVLGEYANEKEWGIEESETGT